MTGVRVLNLPTDHDFVRQALPPETVFDGPMSGEQAKGWEPSPAFTEEWVRSNSSDFDLVHLHFGFETLSAEELMSWTNLLRQLEIPLVFTAHDLRNPHHPTPERYDGLLRILVEAATEVVTLTGGAARQVADRYERPASVISHPPLIAAGPRAEKSGTVGISLKPRAQVVDADAVVMAVLRGVEAARPRRPTATLRVNAHPDLSLPLAREAAEAGRLVIAGLEHLSPAQFAAALDELEVAVLPYRFGTHSGWLEACRDVGTRVVAPDCGFYAEQWDEVLSYGNNEQDGFDAASLTDATCRALLAGSLRPSGQRQVGPSRAGYAAVYDRALGRLR